MEPDAAAAAATAGTPAVGGPEIPGAAPAAAGASSSSQLAAAAAAAAAGGEQDQALGGLPPPSGGASGSSKRPAAGGESTTAPTAKRAANPDAIPLPEDMTAASVFAHPSVQTWSAGVTASPDRRRDRTRSHSSSPTIAVPGAAHAAAVAAGRAPSMGSAASLAGWLQETASASSLLQLGGGGGSGAAGGVPRTGRQAETSSSLATSGSLAAPGGSGGSAQLCSVGSLANMAPSESLRGWLWPNDEERASFSWPAVPGGSERTGSVPLPMDIQVLAPVLPEAYPPPEEDAEAAAAASAARVAAAEAARAMEMRAALWEGELLYMFQSNMGPLTVRAVVDVFRARLTSERDRDVFKALCDRHLAVVEHPDGGGEKCLALKAWLAEEGSAGPLGVEGAPS